MVWNILILIYAYIIYLFSYLFSFFVAFFFIFQMSYVNCMMWIDWPIILHLPNLSTNLPNITCDQHLPQTNQPIYKINPKCKWNGNLKWLNIIVEIQKLKGPSSKRVWQVNSCVILIIIIFVIYIFLKRIFIWACIFMNLLKHGVFLNWYWQSKQF